MRKRREVLDWVLVISEISVAAFAGLAVRQLAELFLPPARSWGLLLILAVLIIILIAADRGLRAWLKRQAWWGENNPSENDE